MRKSNLIMIHPAEETLSIGVGVADGEGHGESTASVDCGVPPHHPLSH